MQYLSNVIYRRETHNISIQYLLQTYIINKTEIKKKKIKLGWCNNFAIVRTVCVGIVFIIKTVKMPTFPQLMYSTAVSRKKKYTNSSWWTELTKFGARKKKRHQNFSVSIFDFHCFRK